LRLAPGAAPNVLKISLKFSLYADPRRTNARDMWETPHRPEKLPLTKILMERFCCAGEREGRMEQASSHNAFTALFVLSFFAAFATVVFQFG
jgi:hypothetical protein